MTLMPLMATSQLVLLALCVWREAGGEPHEAQVAVGCSVINRVRRPAWWGRTILEVLFRKWQYSSLTAPGDPNLVRWPFESDPSWMACLEVADGVIAGRLQSVTPHADSYHDTSIAPPAWATPETFVGQVGHLRFYNLDHDVETEGPL